MHVGALSATWLFFFRRVFSSSQLSYSRWRRIIPTFSQRINGCIHTTSETRRASGYIVHQSSSQSSKYIKPESFRKHWPFSLTSPANRACHKSTPQSRSLYGFTDRKLSQRFETSLKML